MPTRKRKRVADTNDSEEDDERGIVEFQKPNHILFYSPVTRLAFSRLRRILLHLEKRPPKSDRVILHVISEGGDAYAGLAIYDALRGSKLPLVSVVEGECMSAGTLVALAADRRHMTANATLMVHEIRSGLWGPLGEQQVDLRNTAALMDKYIGIYKSRTHMTRPQVVKELKTDAEMGLQLALERGFVHGVWPQPGTN